MIEGDSISYGNLSFRFQLLYVPRKTMEISVHPDGSVVVKAPLGADVTSVQERLSKRAGWIKRQLDYFHQFQPRTPGRWYVSGETHLYLGRQYRLKVSPGNMDRVKLVRGVLEISCTNGSPEKVKAVLDRWYSERAKAKYNERLIRAWPQFESLRLAMPIVQVKRMKKRWGSLSDGGILTINTALIRAPQECIDYVITHELCHLEYRNHGPAFYTLLEKVMPDWSKRKHRLELVLV